MGLQAAAELRQQHSLAPSVALEVSKVVLWALEVGDLILGLNEEHRSLQQISNIDMGQLASLHLGVSTGDNEKLLVNDLVFVRHCQTTLLPGTPCILGMLVL